MQRSLEIAAFNLTSALISAGQGVDRIEFCADFNSGGITPNESDFIELKRHFVKLVYVMIRPRGGNFVYSSTEINQMKKSIQKFVKLGADGFVFGVLSSDNKVDIKANKELILLTEGLPVTFHKAFDRVIDPYMALEEIIDLGFRNILSSGREKLVLQGIDLLNQLKKKSKGRINFIAGGGVRASNISAIIKGFETDFYHSSAVIDNGDIANSDEIINLLNIIKTA